MFLQVLTQTRILNHIVAYTVKCCGPLHRLVHWDMHNLPSSKSMNKPSTLVTAVLKQSYASRQDCLSCSNETSVRQGPHRAVRATVKSHSHQGQTTAIDWTPATLVGKLMDTCLIPPSQPPYRYSLHMEETSLETGSNCNYSHIWWQS